MDNLERKLKHYRLSRDEYALAQKQLGRDLQGVEWALFSALWSEHCSYKSSRVHLKNLFSKSPRVLMSFGENAGVIDLGEGERVGFKMESHNHPSYIEPYQGAATGVGGILRDIFTMGARPIALANYLCFGEPSAPRMSALVDGVVRGIGGYGNCVGVPTITGQTEFHSSYNKNVLVNALAVGLFSPGEPVVTSKAEGVGNWVVYVGAKTGKDGVHGASMASESFDANSEAKKPTIQKGDPFLEKLLIESCIQVMQENLVVAIQDMGAAGLTSSSFEMAAKGGVGFKIHLDQVPLRDSSMTPEEILLSESQERMLMVVEPKNFEKLKKVFSHWDLDAEVIGEVTKDTDVELFWRGECITKIDPKILVDEAPRYERPYAAWSPKNRTTQFVPLEKSLTAAADKGSQSAAAGATPTKLAALKEILKDVRGTSRHWIYDQYDQRVGAKTAADCNESVGIVRLPSTGRALGLVLGLRPYVMRLDARLGAIDSIAYPALELAAKGFLPLAATDCLNFGNPENSTIMSEFVATVQNMSAQCEALSVPIISGNVSFYNETLGENITSTPTTGLVGLRDSVEGLPKSHFIQKNDEVFLLRLPLLKMQGQWAELKNKMNEAEGDLDVKTVAAFVDVVRHLASIKGVHSTRLVGKFGVAYALARMCTADLGVQVSEAFEGGLFTENLYEVLFAVHPDQAFAFKSLFQKMVHQVTLPAPSKQQVELKSIGEVSSGIFKIGDEISCSVKELSSDYNSQWEAHFAGIS